MRGKVVCVLAFLSLQPPLYAGIRPSHSLSKAKRLRPWRASMSRKRVSAVRPPPADGRPKNQLLAALPTDAFQRLLPDLKTIALRPKQLLQKQGERVRHVY